MADAKCFKIVLIFSWMSQPDSVLCLCYRCYICWQTPTNASWNQQFSQEQQKVCDLIQHSHPTERQRNHRTVKGLPTRSAFLSRFLSNSTGDLPNDIPHQEEEGVLGRGAETLSIYCYLLVRREEDVWYQTNRITAETSVKVNSP